MTLPVPAGSDDSVSDVTPDPSHVVTCMAISPEDVADETQVTLFMSALVRKYGVIVEQLDRLDEAGHLRIRVHGGTVERRDAAIADLTGAG